MSCRQSVVKRKMLWCCNLHHRSQCHKGRIIKLEWPSWCRWYFQLHFHDTLIFCFEFNWKIDPDDQVTSWCGVAAHKQHATIEPKMNQSNGTLQVTASGDDHDNNINNENDDNDNDDNNDNVKGNDYKTMIIIRMVRIMVRIMMMMMMMMLMMITITTTTTTIHIIGNVPQKWAIHG